MTYDVDCPASDWKSIQNYLDLTSHAIPWNERAYGGSPAPAGVEVTGRSSLRQLFNIRGIFTDRMIGSVPNVTFRTYETTSQQVAVADALATTGSLWAIALANTTTKDHGSVLSQLDAVHSINTGYYQPYTSVVCENDVILGASDTDPLAFPAYYSLGVQIENASRFSNSTPFDDHLIFHNLSKLDVSKTTRGLGEYRLRWVELPFTGTAIGAIILFPRSSQNTTQEILTCNIGAGWGSSTMNTSTVSGSAGPVLSQVDSKAALDLYHSKNAQAEDWALDFSKAEEAAPEHEILFYSPIFPQRQIKMTEEWASYLNPSIKYLNTTVFDSLMGLDMPFSLRTQAEIIVSAMMATGLSRIGSTSQLQGTVKQVTEPDQSVGLDGNYWFAAKGNNVF